MHFHDLFNFTCIVQYLFCLIKIINKENNSLKYHFKCLPKNKSLKSITDDLQMQRPVSRYQNIPQSTVLKDATKQ